MDVRDFVDGCEIAQALLVREVELRSRRDGGEFLKLTLGDRSGSVPAMIWDGVAEARDLCLAGEIVFVNGRFNVHPRFGPQLTVLALRAASDGEYVRDDLVDGPVRTASQMEDDLRELLATIPTRPPGPTTATHPLPSATTRPTGTGCSSTA
jgi:3'-5' exoribonuclease